jgi:hypothetical protein
VLLVRAAVPAALGLPGREVDVGLLAVVREHRVAPLDVAVVEDHRLGDVVDRARADLPLQEADPQHELSQRGRALVELDAAELLQRHRLALVAELALPSLAGCAEGLELVEDLALDALEVLERDVQEVAAAAGGVEHAQGAEPMMEAFDLGARLLQLRVARLPLEVLGLAREKQGGRLRVAPFLAQRLDHRRHDEAFDVGPRGVVGAEGVAFLGIEGALEQRAEDRGLDLAPVGLAAPSRLSICSRLSGRA